MKRQCAIGLSVLSALALPMLWLLHCGCSSIPGDSLTRRGDATITRLLSTNPVPVEIEDHHILVQGTLNGHKIRLMLDTAASHVAVSPEVAAAAAIRETERVRFGAFGDEHGAAKLGVAESLTVGTVVAERMPVFIMPIPPAFQADGFLGLSFLRQFTFHLDYEQKLLSFAPPANSDHTGEGSSVPLQVEAAHLSIQVEVDGTPAKLIVDTGASHGLILESWFVEEAKLRARYPKRLNVVTGGDLLSPIRGEILRLETLTLGNFTLTNEFVVFDTMINTKRGDFAGLVGGGILRRFNLTFDVPGRRLWIKPNAGFAQESPPSAIVRSGLVCAPEGIIEDVIPNSPAAEAGVQKGDRLLEINGVSVQSLKFWEIKHAFRAEPGTRVTLRLQASGETPREVTLVLRDLL